jgi:hypothetical protein
MGGQGLPFFELMEEEKAFDIRALIGMKESKVVEMMKELQYVFAGPTPSPYYKGQTLMVYQRYDTQLILTIDNEAGLCICVSVAEKFFQAVKEWVESSTKIIPDAKLNATPPPGVTIEVREDDQFWYSIRKSEEVYNVTITKRI